MHFVSLLVGADTSLATFAFHYTVSLGIDDVRTIGWLTVWPAVWIATTVFCMTCAYGVYRRDVHAGYAWLALAVTSTMPWLLALHYLAAINRS